MHGWKTWASGIGTMLTGLGMIGTGLAADPMSFEAIVAGLAMFWAGLGILGIGHKVEKAAK